MKNFTIIKNKVWNQYLLRIIEPNIFILFLISLSLFIGGQKIALHKLIIIILPLILYFLKNSLTISKYFIASIDIVEKTINIKYFTYFKKCSIKMELEKLTFKKVRCNSIREGYYLSIENEKGKKIIKQYENSGWNIEDFDKIITLNKMVNYE